MKTDILQTDKDKLLQDIVTLEQRVKDMNPEESGAAYRQHENMQAELKGRIQVALNWGMDQEEERMDLPLDIPLTVGDYIDVLAHRYKLKKEE
ncbi:MAG: hypothetical protein Q8L34_03420 [Candidatus Woesearchaeota archaeon]|nr:hypothetical protein [Candidatus Woesearchaeota archaeon]